MEATPEILIIASPENPHVKSMEKYLHTKYPNKTFFIWNLAWFPTTNSCSMLLNQQKFRVAISVYQENTSIVLDRLHSIWWYAPRPPQLHESITDASHINFAYVECCQFLESLWYVLECFWINNPEKQEIALNPIYQLYAAKKVDLTIPDTLITSYPPLIPEFWKKHQQQIIYRQLVPFSACQDEMKASDLANVESCKLAPLIFQETIRYQEFLNAIVIRDFVMVAQLYRNNANELLWRKCDEGTISQDTIAKLKRLVKNLGLIYARIAMGVDVKGNYVFFSLDPFGSFLEMEEQTGVHLTEILGELLVHGS